MSDKFEPGDRVEIVGDCSFRGTMGEVVGREEWMNGIDLSNNILMKPDEGLYPMAIPQENLRKVS